MMDEILFYFVGALCVMSAVLSVLAKDIMHAIAYLAGFFISAALIYLLLGAPFLAAIHILVYVGGVIALMLFAIMLIKTENHEKEMKSIRKVAYALLVIIFLILILKLVPFISTENEMPAEFTAKDIGLVLFTKYLVPFEVLGVLLTAAVVGAIAAASKK